MINNLEKYFESKIEAPLIRHRNKQRKETLINEEDLLLVKYLRGERKAWIPRITFCVRIVYLAHIARTALF
jgi:hypothetical protein